MRQTWFARSVDPTWLQYVREKVNHALTLDMMEVEKFEERKKDYEEEKEERRRLR